MIERPTPELAALMAKHDGAYAPFELYALCVKLERERDALREQLASQEASAMGFAEEAEQLREQIATAGATVLRLKRETDEMSRRAITAEDKLAEAFSFAHIALGNKEHPRWYLEKLCRKLGCSGPYTEGDAPLRGPLHGEEKT